MSNRNGIPSYVKDPIEISPIIKNNKGCDVKTLVLFDTETTGLPSPGNNPSITELCFIAVTREELLTQQRTPRVRNKLLLCLNPCKHIEYSATKVTGLHNDALEDMPTFKKQAQLISMFLTNLPQPACLIAHNGNWFDFPLLVSQLVHAKVEVPDGILCADSLEAFRTFDGLPPVAEYLLQKRLARNSSAVSLTTDIHDVQLSNIVIGASENLDTVYTASENIKAVNDKVDHDDSPDYRKRTADTAKFDGSPDYRKRTADSAKFDGSPDYCKRTADSVKFDGSPDYHKITTDLAKFDNEDVLCKEDKLSSLNQIKMWDNCEHTPKQTLPIIVRPNKRKSEQQSSKDQYQIRDEVKRQLFGNVDEDIEHKKHQASDQQLRNNSVLDNKESIDYGYKSPTDTDLISDRSSNKSNYVSSKSNIIPTDASTEICDVHSEKSYTISDQTDSEREILTDLFYCEFTLNKTVDSTDMEETCSKGVGDSLVIAQTSSNDVGNISVIAQTSSNGVGDSSVITQTCSNGVGNSSVIADTCSNGVGNSSVIAQTCSNGVGNNSKSVCVSSDSNTKDDKYIPNINVGKKLSYSLENVFYREFGQWPQAAHTAEGDCSTLLKIIHKKMPYFLSWCDQQAVLLTSISSMY